MSDYQLAVDARQGTGKGYTRKIRAQGRVPGVCYSPTQEATSIEFDPTVLETMLRKSAAGLNTLIDLSGGGLDGQVVLVKELQRDPVRGDLLHADLYAIDVNKSIQVSVPIHVTGTAKGVALADGILDLPLREVEVLCLPRSIPEELPLDVTELDLGDSLHIRDIPLPEGVELASDGDLTVVSVVAPAKAESEAAAEEAAEEEAAAAAPAEGAPAESAEKEAERPQAAHTGFVRVEDEVYPLLCAHQTWARREQRAPVATAGGAPLTEAEKRLLVARAQRYGARTSQRAQDRVDFVVLQRQSRAYGIELTSLRAIQRLATWCPVPEADSVVPGIIHFRGELLSLHDLGPYLEQTCADASEAAADCPWLLIVEHDDRRLGLLADDVVGITTLSRDTIKSVPIALGTKSDCFAGGRRRRAAAAGTVRPVCDPVLLSRSVISPGSRPPLEHPHADIPRSRNPC